MPKPKEFVRHFADHVDRVYRGVVVNVIDGDTLDVQVDVGFSIYPVIRVRVADVNTPELKRGTIDGRIAAVRAKQFVEARALGDPCILITNKDRRTFERYVGHVLLEPTRDEVASHEGGGPDVFYSYNDATALDNIVHGAGPLLTSLSKLLKARGLGE